MDESNTTLLDEYLRVDIHPSDASEGLMPQSFQLISGEQYDDQLYFDLDSIGGQDQMDENLEC